MAAVLHTSPDSHVPLNRRLGWELSIDDLGSDPTVNRLIYQLKYDGGDNITEQEVIDTQGERVWVDFNLEAESLVDTNFPKLAAGITNEPNFVADVVLRYGVISYDTSTCDPPSITWSESSAVKIYNSQIPWSTYDRFGEDVWPLTDRPEKYTLFKGTQDSLLLYRAGGATDIITYDYTRPSTSGSTSANATFETNLVPLSPEILGLNADTFRLETTLDLDTGDVEYEKTYTVDFIDPVCYPHASFYWLEPLGSWCVQDFYIKESGGSTSFEHIMQGSKFETGFSTSNPESYTRINGALKSKSVGFKQTFTLFNTYKSDLELSTWLSMINAGRDFFLRMKTDEVSSTYTVVSVRPTSTNVTSFKMRDVVGVEIQIEINL